MNDDNHQPNILVVHNYMDSETEEEIQYVFNDHTGNDKLPDENVDEDIVFTVIMTNCSHKIILYISSLN